MGASPCGSNYSREPVTSLKRSEIICELNSILWISCLRIIMFKLIFFWINVMSPKHHGHSKTLNRYGVLPVLGFFLLFFFSEGEYIVTWIDQSLIDNSVRCGSNRKTRSQWDRIPCPIHSAFPKSWSCESDSYRPNLHTQARKKSLILHETFYFY